MNKYLLAVILSVGLFSGVFFYTSAQEGPVLTATLHSETPPAKTIPPNAQFVDVAKITLTASGGDVYLNGIYLNTDVSGGLSNFTNIYLYFQDPNTGLTLLGAYPSQSENPNLVEFSNVIIGNGLSKTYLVRASLSSSVAGQIRVGFSGFTFATQATPALSGVPIYGNIMTFVDSYGNPISIPTPTVIPTPTPSLTPTSTPTLLTTPTPASLGFTSLAALGLKEGETISSAGSADPDIYIPNDWGYKRLFLNPVIFNFYSHLGGFANVKNISSSTRDTLVTSGLFRNCEINDTKVYGVEVTGEDTGTLHWVNTSGQQAVADDSEFFKKVFCINNDEFSWYAKGSDYTSVNQVPPYSR